MSEVTRWEGEGLSKYKGGAYVTYLDYQDIEKENDKLEKQATHYCQMAGVFSSLHKGLEKENAELKEKLELMHEKNVMLGDAEIVLARENAELRVGNYKMGDFINKHGLDWLFIQEDDS